MRMLTNKTDPDLLATYVCRSEIRVPFPLIMEHSKEWRPRNASTYIFAIHWMIFPFMPQVHKESWCVRANDGAWAIKRFLRERQKRLKLRALDLFI